MGDKRESTPDPAEALANSTPQDNGNKSAPIPQDADKATPQEPSAPTMREAQDDRDGDPGESMSSVRLDKEGGNARVTTGESGEGGLARDVPSPDAEKDDELQPQPVLEDRCARIFNGLSKIGPIILLAALCAVIWPDFLRVSQALYCPGESDAVAAFLNCLAHNSWMAPISPLNGGEAQWPAFFWLIGGLALIPGVKEAGILLPLAGSISAALALLGVWALCMGARFGARTGLAAGLILFCSPLFMPLPHFIGVQPLACGLLLFSLAFFCRGWLGKGSIISLPLAFILAGLAGLAGGVIFLAIPLIASLVFFIWSGKFRRAQSWDALIGFVLLLALIGAWLGVLMLGHYDASYLPGLFAGNWHFTWPLERCWWLALLLACVGLLPWIMIVLGVSWIRVLGSSLKTFAASRKDNGSALIWISFVVACLASVVMPHPVRVALILGCLAAPLLGKAFIHLSSAGNRFFFFLASLFIFALGLVVLGASFEFSRGWLLGLVPPVMDTTFGKILPSLGSLPILGGILAVGGIVLGVLCVRRFREGGGLVFSTLITIAVSLPALLMVTPELGRMPEARLKTIAALEQQYNEAVAAHVAPAPAAEKPVVPAAPEQAIPAAPQESPAPQETPGETVGEIPSPAPAQAPQVPDGVQSPAPAEVPASSQDKPSEPASSLPASTPPPDADATNVPQEEVTKKEIIIVPDVSAAVEPASPEVKPESAPDAASGAN